MNCLDAARSVREGRAFLWHPDRPDSDGQNFYFFRAGDGGSVVAVYDGREETLAGPAYEDRDALAAMIEFFYQPEQP